MRRLVVVLVVLFTGLLVWMVTRADGPPLPSPGEERVSSGDGAPTAGPDAAGDERPEDDGGAGPEGDRPRLVVRVRDSGGLAAEGATVLLVRNKEEVGRGVTDGDGLVTLVAPGGSGHVVALHGGSVPRVVPASLEAGRVDIAFALGLEISGRVLVDDAVPVKPVRLRLYGSAAFPDLADLPPPVRAEPGCGQAYADTTGDGRFRFTGLPEGWAGTLALPWEVELVDPPGNGICFDLEAPRTDMLVKVRRRPTISGRVVRAGEPSGVTAAVVRFEYQMAGGGGGGSMRGQTDGNGLFSLVVHARDFTRAALVVTDADGRGKVRLEIEPSRLDPHLELGDVELAASRWIEILVRTTDERPVEGAIIRGPRASKIRGGPTDSQGRAQVQVDADTDSVQVAARGTRAVTVPLPPAGTSGPVRVVLPRGAMIAIRVLEPDGSVPKGIHVQIRANADLFTGPGGAPEAIFGPLACGGAFSTSWGAGRAAAGFAPDAEGRVDLAGIRPDVRVDISVVDVRSGTVLAETAASAGAGRTEEVTLRLRRAARKLVVHVVGASGKTLDWAWVRLGPGVSERTDEEGRVSFAGLRSDRYRLEVRRHGFVTVVRPEFAIPADEEEVKIALEPGRTVRLGVTDPDGRPVPVTEFGLVNRDMGGGWWVPEESPGRHLLRDLPAGRVTIFAEVAGRRFTVEHDTAVAEASLRVPRLGALRVRMAPVAEERRLRLIPLGPSGEAQEMEVDPPDVEEDRPVEYPAVLPGRYRVALLPSEGEVPEAVAEVEVVAGKTAEVSLRD